MKEEKKIIKYLQLKTMKALNIKIWDVTWAQLTGNFLALNAVFEK